MAITNYLADIVAKFTYDAWGKVLSVTNASGVVQTSSSFIGNINPIRYRGYYYDTDLGLYYLQSRYYDPETGRFVNADDVGTVSNSLQGFNLYAYCNNDPVNMSDPDGHLPKWLSDIGNKIKSAWNSAVSWAKNTFGAQSRSTVEQRMRPNHEHR